MAEVRLEKVIKRFGEAEVVHGIDLDIAHNEFLVLLGPSGCGKSTTLRMISGLEDITAGTIRIGERIVNDLPPRSRNVSMVFQNYALYPHMTVAENLGFSLKIAKVPPREIKKRVEDAAAILGLEAMMERLPAHLSGGEQQRVAMGRAIVRQPDVFLFDEPLSNLDAKLRVQMRTEIKRLHQRVQTTIIYVTHDQVEAMTLADTMVIMRGGHIEQVGSPLDVFERPANTFVAGFIGSPPMNLIEATVVAGEAGGTALRFDDGTALPLPIGKRDTVAPGAEVVVGIRAENLVPEGHAVAQPNEAWRFEGRIAIAEPLGTETLLFTELGGREVLSKMFNPERVRAGETRTFVVNLDRLHLFARPSGRAI